VQPETKYLYWVQAFNGAGKSPLSEQAEVTTPPAPPLAPSALIAAASAPGPVAPTVTMTWTDNATNESGFVVQRAPDASGVPGTFANVITINQPKPASGAKVVYVDNTVQPKSTYWYRVYAFNGAGASGYSNQVSVVTPGEPPQTPSNLRMVGVTSSSITLGWNDNSANETHFQLQRSMNGTSGWADIAATLAANTVTYKNTGLASRTN
jgi:titin